MVLMAVVLLLLPGDLNPENDFISLSVNALFVASPSLQSLASLQGCCTAE